MLSVPHLVLFIHFISKEWDCLFNLCTQRIHRIWWLSLCHKHHVKNNDLLTEGVYFTSKPVKLWTERSKPFSTKLEPGGNVWLVLAPIQIQFNLWTIQEPACFSTATASWRATSLCHNCKCLWLSQLQQRQKKKKKVLNYEMPKHLDQWKLHHWNTIVCAFTDLALHMVKLFLIKNKNP